jgi:hypothetical protein
MKSVFALIPAAFLAGAVLAAPAYANKSGDPGAHAERVSAQKKHFKSLTAKKPGKRAKTATLKVRKKVAAKSARKSATKTPKFAQTSLSRKIAPKPQVTAMKMSGAKMNMSDQALNINGASDMRVAQIIRDMAPSYGVPTWFALRIANVESGYNPYARGPRRRDRRLPAEVSDGQGHGVRRQLLSAHRRAHQCALGPAASLARHPILGRQSQARRVET